MKSRKSSAGKEKRLARKHKRQELEASIASVARANSLLDPLKPLPAFQHFQRDELNVHISCHRFIDLSTDIIEWAINLTERNIRTFSEKCSWGWNATQKREEMTDEAALYLIAKSITGTLLGFTHFRFDMDYGVEVLYCYELQLEPVAQRKGLGSFLLHTLELIAFTNQMKKVVLTALLNNPASLGFFKALRYSVDETNPDEDENVSYQILSKLNPKMNHIPSPSTKPSL